jgi:dihydroxyacetone kinase
VISSFRWHELHVDVQQLYVGNLMTVLDMGFDNVSSSIRKPGLASYNCRRHGVQVDVQRLYVGNLMTALDMAGFSLSLLQLDDKRLQRLDAATQVWLHP